MSYISFQRVYKYYAMRKNKITALDNIDFEIERGEFCVIVGPSGAGKTTLLNILGGMDQLSDGDVFLDGHCISRLGERALTEYRRYEVGFVFQF